MAGYFPRDAGGVAVLVVTPATTRFSDVACAKSRTRREDNAVTINTFGPRQTAKIVANRAKMTGRLNSHHYKVQKNGPLCLIWSNGMMNENEM